MEDRMNREGAFRFTYFTDKYDQTWNFYEDKLGFHLEHSWDRSDQDKGALFQAGAGLIEILLFPNDESHKYAGLDYRSPQGVFMCIQVWDIDQRFERYKSLGLNFAQQITDQSWGHRSFSLVEPNGLILFFFQE
jgi:catechol 2,3-dioxygenase-like lactoylglutathione lyase family enzyme